MTAAWFPAAVWNDPHADSDGSSSEEATASARYHLWSNGVAPRQRTQSVPPVPPIYSFPGKKMDASPLQWKHKAKSVSPSRKAAKTKLQPRLRVSRKDRASESEAPAFAEHLVNFVWGLGAGAAQDPGRGEAAKPVAASRPIAPVTAPPQKVSKPSAAPTATPQKASAGPLPCGQAANRFGCFASPLPHGPGRGEIVPPRPVAYSCNAAGVSSAEQEHKWRTCNIANMCEDEEELRLTSSAQGDLVNLHKNSGNSASSWTTPWRAV